MPHILASSIIDRAAMALQDSSNVRWPRADLLGYINDGQREVVIKKPNAYVMHTCAQLVAGTRQMLPVLDGALVIDPLLLIDVLRNSTGRAVRIIERELLDSLNPDWHNAPQTLLVQHYMHNPMDGKAYLVYPPSNGIGCVDIIYSATPPAAATESESLSLDDIYQGPLLDYVMYRSMSKDAEYASDPSRAASHYTAFAAALQEKATNELGASPNTRAQSRRK